MEFRHRLHKLRERKHISRCVLSELCGLHPDAIRRYEKVKAEPTLHSLIAIAEYFNVPIDYLVVKSETQ